MTQKVPLKKSSLDDAYTHQVSSPYMTLNTNMTSDDPRMTSDDPGCTFGKFDSGWRLHPLSFKSILALYTKYDFRWPQDDLRWPQNLINPSGCEDAHTDQVPSSYVLWTWDIVFTRLFQKMNKWVQYRWDSASLLPNCQKISGTIIQARSELSNWTHFK